MGKITDYLTDYCNVHHKWHKPHFLLHYAHTIMSITIYMAACWLYFRFCV